MKGLICAVVRVRERNQKISGDNSERDPPVPIPNTEVKPLSADGTWLATARESRTSPGSRERRCWRSGRASPTSYSHKSEERGGPRRRTEGPEGRMPGREHRPTHADLRRQAHECHTHESQTTESAMILSSSMAEHSAVNRVVVGSSPTWGASTPHRDVRSFLLQ